MEKVIISRDEMFPVYSLKKTKTDKLAWDSQVKSDIPDDLYFEYVYSLKVFENTQRKIELIYEKISREQSEKKRKERKESEL